MHPDKNKYSTLTENSPKVQATQIPMKRTSVLQYVHTVEYYTAWYKSNNKWITDRHHKMDVSQTL